MSRTKRDEAERQFGERLCGLLVEAREGADRSVKDVAEKAGLGLHGLYAIERKDVLSPGVRTVYLLAREYGLDLSDLARQAAQEA